MKPGHCKRGKLTNCDNESCVEKFIENHNDEYSKKKASPEIALKQYGFIWNRGMSRYPRVSGNKVCIMNVDGMKVGRGHRLNFLDCLNQRFLISVEVYRLLTTRSLHVLLESVTSGFTSTLEKLRK